MSGLNMEKSDCSIATTRDLVYVLFALRSVLDCFHLDSS